MSESAYQALIENFAELPAIKNMVTHNGVIELEKKAPQQLLTYLAKTVVGQQLSVAAANTIWQRVLDTAETENLTLEDLLVAQYQPVLRKCGLSNNKTKAVVEARNWIVEKRFDPTIFADCDAKKIQQEITSIWGFGPWSAEMTSMFFFGLPDVWSATDAALDRGLAMLAKQNKVDENEILQRAKPWRTYFAMHIWRALDAKLIID